MPTRRHATTQADYHFPPNFRWGTATSSHQVEGNDTNNDWWLAEQGGGYVYENQTSGQACDWWNRAEEDFDRMADMNQNAHRMSIEWSRVEPLPGVWDEEAIARYREMVKGLRQRGIEPMITLHHFTNPLWMAEKGGWENPEVVIWFERYVRKIVSALGDLTDLWCTINEPNVMISQAYGVGRWPPGKQDFNAGMRVTLNLARAHAAAYHAIHELNPRAQVGLAKHLIAYQPWRRWMPIDLLAMNIIAHLFHHLLLEMITSGIMRVPGQRSLLVPETAHSLDWLGVNYYQRYRIRFNPLARKTFFIDMGTDPDLPQGPGEWGEIHPEGMFQTLQMLWKRYKLPMLITENGIPDQTDEHRPGFIVTHLYQLWRAISSGMPITGYYFWSLLDNFEWTEGYNPHFRFGLIAVDHETQARKMRLSGKLYTDICRESGLTREILQTFTPHLVPELFSA